VEEPKVISEISAIRLFYASDPTKGLGAEKAAIHAGDAIPVRLNEEQSFTSSGGEPLELMIVGVAKDFPSKDALMNVRR